MFLRSFFVEKKGTVSSFHFGVAAVLAVLLRRRLRRVQRLQEEVEQRGLRKLFGI